MGKVPAIVDGEIGMSQRFNRRSLHSAASASPCHRESGGTGDIPSVRSTIGIFCLALVSVLVFREVEAQDLEPRRWTPIPPGMSVVGAGYVRTDGDVSFDPVLNVQDATVDGDTFIVSYVRSFELGGKRIRLDALLPWADLRWDGILDGTPATRTRTGLADPYLRLSVILSGAPVDMSGPAPEINTVIGAAVGIIVPWGEHFEDKLLNLGQNRFVVRPQLGVLHTRGAWSYELSASTFLYADNDDFFGGQELEQDPLFAMQAHVIRQFNKRGYWASLSTGYAWDGESTVNGVEKGDKKRIFLSAATIGMPVGRSQGLKFAYVRNRTNASTGNDIDSFAVAWSLRF